MVNSSADTFLINKRAFTLIELLVVVAIVGILAALGIANYSSYRERVYDAVAITQVKDASTAKEAFFATNTKLPTSFSLSVRIHPLGSVSAGGFLPGGHTSSINFSSLTVADILPGFVHAPDTFLSYDFNRASTIEGMQEGFQVLGAHCRGSRGPAQNMYGEGMTSLFYINSNTNTVQKDDEGSFQGAGLRYGGAGCTAEISG